jgi:hypothetical protein
MSFLTDELNVEFPNPWQTWENVGDILRLNHIVLDRNCYVSEGDLPFIQVCAERYNQVYYDGTFHAISFGDQFLLIVNKTIVSFFTELQDLSPEFSSAD